MVNFLENFAGGVRASQSILNNAAAARQRNALQQFGPAAMGGDRQAINALAGAAPEAAMAFSQYAQKQRQMSQQEHAQVAGQMARMVMGAADKEAAYSSARASAAAMGLDVSALPEQFDDTAQGIVAFYAAPPAEQTALQRELSMLPENERLAALRAHFGLAPKAGTLPGEYSYLSPEQQAAAARMQAGFDMTAKDRAQIAIQQQNAASNRMRAQAAEAGKLGTVVNVSPQSAVPLGRTTRTTVEKGLVSDLDLLGQLDQVVANFDPASLTYRGQAEGFVTRQAEKLGFDPGEQARDALTQRTEFVTGVEQLFNAYRKEITGAAAAVQELERLKKSFLNADMSPTEFKAAESQFRAELSRGLRLKDALVRIGYKPGTPEFGEQFDELFTNGATGVGGRAANQVPRQEQRVDAETRFYQLLDSGMSEQEVYSALKEEGYGG